MKKEEWAAWQLRHSQNICNVRREERKFADENEKKKIR